MKNTVWNRVNKNVIIFPNEAEATKFVKANNKLAEDGRFILFLTSADICSNCGGGLDTMGWCPSYCMD